MKDKLKDNVCWGETDTGNCNIKSTALATLALTHIQDDVEDYENWLLSKRIKDTGLTWFLEIDSNNQTECDINGVKITIEGNKKIATLADDVIYIPKTLEMLTPMLSVIPLQLFAYHIGVLRERDVDKPRNLAKAVVVE